MRRMYSRSELSKAIKENLENGSLNIKAKTIKQGQYNEEITFNLNAPYNLSIENIYNRFAEINNVLHCVVNIKITNNTGSSVTIGSGYGFVANTASLELPSNLASKLVDISGKSVAEVGTAGTLISSEPCQILKSEVLGDSSIFILGRFSLVNRATANIIGIEIALNGNNTDRMVIANGESICVTARMALTLI